MNKESNDAMTTHDSANASDVRPMRMNAYYYCFVATGVFEADRMLCAVASAGKAYHHTECWLDDCEYPDTDGSSPTEWIQNAANEAAARIRELEQQVARGGEESTAQEAAPIAHLTIGSDGDNGTASFKLRRYDLPCGEYPLYASPPAAPPRDGNSE